MRTRTVQLLDEAGNVFATARVTDEGTYYAGAIDLTPTPAAVRALFEEFEETVNGRMFSLLDDLQGRIDALAVRAVFEDGSTGPVHDLQVYPGTADVSFRLAEVQTQRKSRSA